MKRLEHIMQRELTRKEFLAAVGIGIVSIMGIGTILRVLSGKSSTRSSTYGSNPYGK